MKSLSMTAILLALAVPVPLMADTGWVVNKDQNKVSIFDTGTTTNVTGSPLTVGLNPVDLALPTGYQKIYIVNNAGNSVSVVSTASPQVLSTLVSSSTYGAFLEPTGIAFAWSSTVSPTLAVIDRKNLATVGGTLRFIDPSTDTFADEWDFGTAGFDPTDIKFTASNSAFWITGKGTDRVWRIVFLDNGPPFTLAPSISSISHASIGEPQRIAVGGTKIYIANAGTTSVTILDYNGVVLGSTDVGAPQKDIALISGKVYVTTTADVVKVLDASSPYSVLDTVSGFGSTLTGLGQASDGYLYVGTATGSQTIFRVKVSASPPVILDSFDLSGRQPFEFLFYGSSSSGETGGGGGGGGGGCYVATAIYGAPSREVAALKTFRDSFVVHHPLGRAFLSVYEQAGPKLARSVVTASPVSGLAVLFVKPLAILSPLSSAGKFFLILVLTALIVGRLRLVLNR